MKFVTMVNSEYIPPLLALIDSLKTHSGFAPDEISLIVLEISDINERDKRLVKSQGIDVEFMNTSNFREFEFDEKLLKNKSKTVNQKKFLIYQLSSSEPMCYLDADLLCLSDITSIRDFEPLSVGTNIGREPPETVYNRPMFNSGLMVFQPSEDRYDRIQSFARNYDEELAYGDQRLLNEYYYQSSLEEVKLLGFEWNVIITMKNHHKKLWEFVNQKGIKFLHFTLCEPWKDINIYDLKSSVSSIIKATKYRREISIWKKHYQNALENAGNL